jgi:anti-sigma factor RsiW
MSDFEQDQRDGKALWLRLRAQETSSEAQSDDVPDPLLLAAYLDGRLDEAERLALEVQMAENEAVLDLALAAREAMAAAPAPHPSNEVLDRALARAQDLVAEEPVETASRKSKTGLFGWLKAPFAGRPAWQPLGLAAAACLALVVFWQAGPVPDGGLTTGIGPQTAQLDPAAEPIDEQALDEFLAEELDMAFLGGLDDDVL